MSLDLTLKSGNVTEGSKGGQVMTSLHFRPLRFKSGSLSYEVFCPKTIFLEKSMTNLITLSTSKDLFDFLSCSKRTKNTLANCKNLCNLSQQFPK